MMLILPGAPSIIVPFENISTACEDNKAQAVEFNVYIFGQTRTDLKSVGLLGLLPEDDLQLS